MPFLQLHGIRFWHSQEEGFKGRKPIDAEFLANHHGDAPEGRDRSDHGWLKSRATIDKTTGAQYIVR